MNIQNRKLEVVREKSDDKVVLEKSDKNQKWLEKSLMTIWLEKSLMTRKVITRSSELKLELKKLGRYH